MRRDSAPRSPGCTEDTGPPGVFADTIANSARSAELDRPVSGVAGTERVEMVVWPLRLDASENAGDDDLLKHLGSGKPG